MASQFIVVTSLSGEFLAEIEIPEQGEEHSETFFSNCGSVLFTSPNASKVVWVEVENNLIGSLGNGGCLSCNVEQGWMNLGIYSTRPTKMGEVLDVFHCAEWNPSSGALTMNEIQKLSQASDVETFIQKNEKVFRCFVGKDGQKCAVVNPQFKRKEFKSDKDIRDLFELMEQVEYGVKEENATLHELFKVARKTGTFNKCLSAGFTTLKKVLHKNNTQVVWHQDPLLKLTKIKFRDTRIEVWR